ncbi:MAG: hypothetical protein HOP21_09935 [Methylotenera sp.]|nr:hypothetical protein [Methylotenera sp.]
MIEENLHKYSFLLGESPFAPALSERILHRFKENGWPGLVQRVCKLVESVENSRNDVNSNPFLSHLAHAMQHGLMLPNSPLLVNCSDAEPRVFACFAVDVSKPISTVLKEFRFIHDGMGGVGYSLSGKETNFIDIIKLIDQDTCAHQSGRPRPASNAVTLPISGDLDKFLNLAGTLAVTNMNVALTDEFMLSLRNGKISQQKFDNIVRKIYTTGQPGIIFPDRIRQISHTENTPFAANVCGEAPLAVDESALLASVNLTSFVSSRNGQMRSFDEDEFQKCVGLCVRMLDGMHDIQTHASDEIRRNTLATRKIGVGIMGFAHALILLGLPYGSQESIQFARNISRILYQSAKAESERLANILGTYPAWKPEHGSARRNANLTAIAGTATIALIAGTSCGIEPLYSHMINQRVIDQDISCLDPIISLLLSENGINPVDAASRLARGETLRQIAGDAIADLCPTALDLSGEVQINVQAALQSSIDCGITKTVNCSNTTSVNEIKKWILHAHENGCVGLTIYRNQSLKNQPIKIESTNVITDNI